MRADHTATERLAALVDRDLPPAEDAEEDTRYQWGVRPGWTPGEPTGRHREETPTRPLWKVGWRAGVIVLVAAAALLGGVGLWGATRGTGTVVVQPDPTPAAPTPAPAETPATTRPAATPHPTPTQVVIHVVGAVSQPGIVALTPGARVQDALEAAGGPLPEADLAGINLARVVTDGEQIPVPRPGETPTPAPGPAPPSGTVPAVPGASPATGGLVDINTAGAAELDTLPGVGPVLADRIIQWRTDNGPFLSVDDLGEVSGIGDKILADLRPHVTV